MKRSVIKGIFPPKMSKEYRLQQISNTHSRGGVGGNEFETSIFAVQPTGRGELGGSFRLISSDHSHPTGTILDTDPQQPFVGEIRRTASFGLVIYDGNQWLVVGGAPPYNNPPQPTGAQSAGSVIEYSRGDHSHATATIPQSSSQTPVVGEIRRTASFKLVIYDGNQWMDVAPPPYNAPPEATGVQSAGTGVEYSRADHSHPTAVLAQSYPQTPVSNEIRFNTNNKLVRWDGSSWVELSVEPTTVPVQTTNTYSETGSQNGEIWYRTNDRAVFFRVNNTRVYPAAALFTVGESATDTGAGNRILLLDSSTTHILRVGGTSNQTVFAYPKLPTVSGDMSSSNLNWNTGAGTSPSGALWWDTSTQRPKFYPNNFAPEFFYTGRLSYVDGLSVSSFAAGTQDGMINIHSNGVLAIRSNNGETTFRGFERTFDLVSEAYVTDNNNPPQALTLVNTAGVVSREDIYYSNSVYTINRRYIEAGDASTVVNFIIPLGFIQLNNNNKTSFRLFIRHQYLRTSGSNPELWGLELALIRADAGTTTRQYYRSTTNASPTRVGNSVYLVVFDASVSFASTWSYYEGTTFIGNQTPPNALYYVSINLRRLRSSESSPRSTTQHKVVAVQTTMPINLVPI